MTEPGSQSSDRSNQTAGPAATEGVEPDQPRAGRLFIMIGLLLLVLAILMVGLWVFFVRTTTDEIQRKELSLVSKEMLEVQARDQGRLTQYDLIDAKAGLYQIPIRRAIERLLENPALLAPAPAPRPASPARPPSSAPAERVR